MTLTELIRTAVEQFINPPTAMVNAQEIREQNLELKDQLKEYQQEIDTQKQAIRGYKTEIESLKNEQFAEDTMGLKNISQQLVEVLKDSNRPLREYDLFEKMGINKNDVNNIKGLANQLRYLEDLNILQCTHKGWRWVK